MGRDIIYNFGTPRRQSLAPGERTPSHDLRRAEELGRFASFKNRAIQKVDNLVFRSPTEDTDLKFVRRRTKLVLGVFASGALITVPVVKEAGDRLDGIECSKRTKTVVVGGYDIARGVVNEIDGAAGLSAESLADQIGRLNPNLGTTLPGDAIRVKVPVSCEQ
jgi:hypothetical protein